MSEVNTCPCGSTRTRWTGSQMFGGWYAHRCLSCGFTRWSNAYKPETYEQNYGHDEWEKWSQERRAQMEWLFGKKPAEVKA